AGAPRAGAARGAELLAREREYRRRRDEAPTAEDYAGLLPDDAALVRKLWDEAEDAPGSGDVSRTLITPAAAVPPPRPELPGFEVLEELGRGGMGVVYK